MNDLFDESDECAFIFAYNSRTGSLQVDAYTPLLHDSSNNVLHSIYLSAHQLYPSEVTDPDVARLLNNASFPNYFVYDPKKKPYKPVSRKVRAQLAELPEKFRIKRQIIGDPLATMPALNPNPPPFIPTERYTQERKEKIDAVHSDDFLWEQERLLLHDFMRKQDKGFAWIDSERGQFRTDFFPPVDIPVVPHKPWVQKNIPIPPGVFKQVCAAVKAKIDAGIYEPSSSSYRSRWFCVLKRDGKTLRPVHSLEPLNKVTIQHSGVPPIPDHLAEQFAGRACGAILDLYVGYDERLIAESSRDYTTFQTPFGAQRLVTLPMGWANSVPIFHDDVTFILQPEIPDITIPYLDDAPVKGPKTQYIDDHGNFETIPQNPGIRRFIWEHFQNVNRVVQRMKYCGGTFSGLKSTICAREITVVGHRCTPEGRIPDPSRFKAIEKWTKCSSVSDVRAFLGTIGVSRMFIKNFAQRAHHLQKLTRNDVPFEFGPDQKAAMDDLKQALLTSPALRPIDYDSPAPVILAVDSSFIAIGYYLAQCDEQNPKRRYFNRFCSITLNEREARFSQPKLELYGLYRALRSLKLYIIGIRKLIVEVDARYIKGMIQNPDIAPNATMNRWIVAISLFHFDLVHVPATRHGPDGLSRRPRQEDDDPPEEDNDFDDWVDNMHGFMHIINDIQPVQYSTTTNAISTFLQSSPSWHTPPLLQETKEGQPDKPGRKPSPPPNVDNFIYDEDRIIAEKIADNTLEYSDIPRSRHAIREEQKLRDAILWLTDLKRPPHLSDDNYARLIRYATRFFKDGPRIWRKDSQGAHKLVVEQDKRISILQAAHDQVGHKGLFATRAQIMLRFWWPHIQSDIHWFVQTCHICQTRQTTQILIPPTIVTPAPLFARAYADTMHMPPSGGFKYIAQARCSLTAWPEFRRLRQENARSLGDWIFEDLLCRWGSLREIITDNGAPFLAALDYLAQKYKIYHIRVSGYNHRANGLVERSHFDIRQSLYKVADGKQSDWSRGTYSVFWADRVTIRRRMGCSPYFAVTGAHPLLPLDFLQATYLMPPPDSTLSTEDLIVRRAITLQKRSEDLAELYTKVFEARREAAIRFEKEHYATIKNYDFKRGDLVLQRNSQIEMSLNRKMQPRYTGPLIVVARNKGGAYILCELDGSVYHRPIAAFRVIPYLPRKSIPFPDDLIDIDAERLEQLQDTDAIDE
jgi:hypothetical protein